MPPACHLLSFFRVALATYQAAIDATNAEHLDTISNYNAKSSIPNYCEMDNFFDLYNKGNDLLKSLTPGLRDYFIVKERHGLSKHIKYNDWFDNAYWNYGR